MTVKEYQVKEGWLGKPKGMLQILWERGWIDSTQVVIGRGVIQKMEKKDFDEDGKLKDENQQYVLSYLLSRRKDFKEEMCQT